MITDTQLRYFTTIVELGSFSEAALELEISQSSISKQIMHLEDALGVKLFDRTSRKVRLTTSGEYLYPDALSALTQINHLKETAARFSLSGQKTISLLILPVIGHYNFYIPFQLFEQDHRDYTINLEELEEPDMYRRISLEDYDAAITYYNPNHVVSNARFFPLIDDEMVLVCHKDDPLSRLSRITPAQLDDVPVLAMQKYTCTNQLYELYFRKHGSNPHILFRGRPNTIQAGAEARRAPALLTRIHTETLHIKNVKLIPFDPPLSGILGMIVNEKSRNKEMIQELLKFISK
ncbi:MAG: LysR family transcriptional regulator [Parasporobacterium sp.]|nr:LysR family transcriptional regulator [Parasporobacterium sp.]